MRWAYTNLQALFVAGVLMVVVGCGGGSSSASVKSPSPGSPASSPTAHSMDPAVTLPGDFPKDFPIYPGARPVFVGGDSSFGTTTWTVNWETTDSVYTMDAFYQAHLSQGDWKITVHGEDAVNGDTISFVRKSNSSKTGDLVISERYLGVTQLALTLTQ